MVNSDDFISRIQQVMDYYQLSSSAFAEKIKVQKSSISHLLSGRNKPSLDFVMKVVKEFEAVELYWLLNGKGSFPVNEISPPIVTSSKITDTEIKADFKVPLQIESNSQKKIERIVIFYSDGSFKEYQP